MNLLLIDTATEQLVVGVARIDPDGSGRLLAHADEPAPRRANVRLLAAAAQVLGECGLQSGDIDGVACGRGPGSFTGVRIGVATAKGVATGRGVPLWGVSTLDAVAWRHAIEGFEGLLGVAGDAMRGEVYPASYRVGGGIVERLDADHVATPHEAATQWAKLDSEVTLAGNGLRKYAQVFSDGLGARAVFSDERLWTPSSAGMFAAWSHARGAGTLGPGVPAELLPVYTRLSDAEENERLRAGVSASPPPENGVSGGVR